MTKTQIQAVMNRVADLNDFGIGVFDQRHKSQAARAEELEEGRARLLESSEACAKCCDWLGTVTKIKSINDRHSSYGLKHIAEKDIGYVTNGVFITAAVHCGFLFRINPRSPNVQFGMSQRSIAAIRSRHKTERK